MGKRGEQWKSVSQQWAVLLSDLVREILPGFQSQRGTKPPISQLLFFCCRCGSAGAATPGSPQSFVPPPCNTKHQHPPADQHRGLCAALVVLKSPCNMYYCFPRSDGVFWRNARYLRCSARWFFCHHRCSDKQNGKQAHSFNRVLLLLSLTNQALTAAGICWGRSSKVGMAEPRSSPSGSPRGAVLFPLQGDHAKLSKPAAHSQRSQLLHKPVYLIILIHTFWRA